MEHDLELVIPRLEILEIEVCNIIYNPVNIGKTCFFYVLVSWKYWKLVFSISWYPGNIGNMIFLIFEINKKTRAEISRRMHRRMSRDLSYETDSGQKLKLFQTPISKWRLRRRPNNSPIWPEPWTIRHRDQISRSGSIPHFDQIQYKSSLALKLIKYK